jgi:hypothetical protein
MERMEKQTAVDYIKEKLMCNEYWYENMTFDQIFEQAKEMEKGQIMKTWYDCKLSIIERNPTDAEQYYNETFKSE